VLSIEFLGKLEVLVLGIDAADAEDGDLGSGGEATLARGEFLSRAKVSRTTALIASPIEKKGASSHLADRSGA
jgi:hypothetical protein